MNTNTQSAFAALSAIAAALLNVHGVVFSIYSDTHKEVYGFRPSWAGQGLMTLSQLEDETDYLYSIEKRWTPNQEAEENAYWAEVEAADAEEDAWAAYQAGPATLVVSSHVAHNALLADGWL